MYASIYIVIQQSIYIISVKNVEMFIFQYDGMFQRSFPGEKYPDKKLLKDKGLDFIIEDAKKHLLIGQTVLVAFDNTLKDSVRKKFPIGPDFVNSTIRQGVLKEITYPKKKYDSMILFEDDSNGGMVLPPIKTSRIIDIISAYELSYPSYVVSPIDINLKELEFFFGFKYFGRGTTEAAQIDCNPLNAFVDARKKILVSESEARRKKYNDFRQAYLSRLKSTSLNLLYDEGETETCSRDFERRIQNNDIPSQKTYVIRCGRRNT
jgi:hypothetical protein